MSTLSRSTSKKKLSIISNASNPSISSSTKTATTPNSKKRFQNIIKNVSHMSMAARRFSTKRQEQQSILKELENENDNYDDNYIGKIDETDIPSYPRFPATMSAEAQYCFMSGYSDLISKELDRMKINYVKDDTINEDNVHKHCYLKHEPIFNTRTECMIFTKYTPLPIKGALPIKESSHKQQLCTTYRLQNALDIMDKLKSMNKKIILNNRHEKHNICPAEHFVIWNKIWRQDFKFEKE